MHFEIGKKYENQLTDIDSELVWLDTPFCIWSKLYNRFLT